MRSWKGLILAGGTGSRLHPLTNGINKHLLPVFDKPMIFYPLTTLMLAGIRDIVIVTTREALPQFSALLGDGSRWGLKLAYRVQDRPGGIAEGFLVAADDLASHSVALILGDNIFYGTGFAKLLEDARDSNEGATIFGYDVANPSAFGVVTLDSEFQPIALEEKPKTPKSRTAVTGLYFYGPDILDIAKSIKPSARGELEITDVNRHYLDQKRLRVKLFGRGVAWLDGGTTSDLFEAGQFVKVIQERTGLRIACPEEIALRFGFISSSDFKAIVATTPNSEYRAYLEQVLETVA
jgi:glucose-1-phosphate thymidylyltransferase